MEFHFYPGQDVGKKRTVEIDRGLYEASPYYRRLVEEYVKTPFKSEMDKYAEKMGAVEAFWTKGKCSLTYSFYDFVREMKYIGVILDHTKRSVVLSEPFRVEEDEDVICLEDLQAEAERLDKIFRTVEGLRRFSIHVTELPDMEVDGVDHARIRLTMAGRKTE